MVLVIDPQIAGISGDMMLSSLVHMGAKKSKIIDGVSASQNFLRGSSIKKIDFKKVNKHGINATSLVLKLDEQHHERKGVESCFQAVAIKVALAGGQVNLFCLQVIIIEALYPRHRFVIIGESIVVE